MTTQEQNHVSRLIAMAETLLAKQNEIQLLIAEWNQNDFFNQITDNDLSEITIFSHLTAAKVSNCITAITAVDTALGDYSSGQAVNLLKMRG